MARQKSYTDQQVIDAAREIIDSGKVVNGTSLRKIIGSGRPDALMADYECLRENIESPTANIDVVEVEQQELPLEIQEVKATVLGDLDRLIGDCYSVAHSIVSKSANIEINQLKQDVAKCQAELEMRENDLNSAYEEIESLRDQLQESQDLLVENKGKSELLLEQNKEFSSSLDTLKDSLKEVETTLAQTNATLDKTVAQNDTLTSENADFKDKNSEMEKSNSTLNGKISTLTDTIKTLESSLKTEQSNHQSVRDELNKTLGGHDAIMQINNTQNCEIKTLNATIQSQAQEIELLKSQIKTKE